MPSPTKLLTYAEWITLPECEDGIEEVVNGEIIRRPPNRYSHTRITDRLGRMIWKQVNESQVIVLQSNFGLIIRAEPLTSRVPDIAVFHAASLEERHGYIHSAPGLAIEVLSPANTRRERLGKLQDYAAIGTPEVWLVSISAETVEVLTLEGSALRTEKIVNSGILTPHVFPEVSVHVKSIFDI